MLPMIISAITGLFGLIKTGIGGLFETKQQALLMEYLKMKSKGANDVAMAEIAARIIMNAQNSEHFLVYAARPIIALSFLVMILGPWYGYIPEILMMKNVPPLYLKLVEYLFIFITGYAGLRTVEKVADKFTDNGTRSRQYLDEALQFLSDNAPTKEEDPKKDPEGE